LGVLYAHGEGVEKNVVEGCKWLSLASAQGHVPAKNALLNLGQKMTPEQIAEGQRLAREFQPQKESPAARAK
jgi:TPR repeat protein